MSFDRTMPPVVVSSVTICLPDPEEDPKVVCYGTIVINDQIRICGCKLITCRDGRARFFGPHRKNREGQSHCVVYALDESIRLVLERAMVSAYRTHLSEREADASIGQTARYRTLASGGPHAQTA